MERIELPISRRTPGLRPGALPTEHHIHIWREVWDSDPRCPSLGHVRFQGGCNQALCQLPKLAVATGVQPATASTVSRFERGGLCTCPTLPWRKDRDSDPGALAEHTISSRVERPTAHSFRIAETDNHNDPLAR